jgi:CubicO group peptidase (beta-lactamase class C family)
MRARVFIFTVAAVLLVGVPGHAQGIVYEVFGTYLDALRQQAGIPGLAATIVDSKGVAWERGYGQQDVGRAIAARADTPFNADGLTQTFTAAMILRCAEERHLSLEDAVGTFKGVNTPEPDATIRQLLTHTTGPADAATFALRLERLAPLWPVVRACAIDSYRETLANLLTRFSMMDSVPGSNAISLAPPAEGVPHPDDAARYAAVMARRALPYAVDGQGRASASSYPAAAASLTPSKGLITTVRDLAKFDLALKDGFLLPETLEAAWSTPVDTTGDPLPHGIGWFVLNYKGEKVVWQFGVGDNASSSLMIMLPGRGLTFIVMANSDRLVKPFPLEAGDVSLSPFARLFLNLFVR